MKEGLLAQNKKSSILVQGQRNIEIPSPPKQFLSNSIKTCKYNCFTFLPKNMFEQFSKSANVYFLIIAVLQSVPQISVTGGIPNILLPLSFVLTVSAVKDLLEDIKRSKSDKEENMRMTQKRVNGNLAKVHWRDLKVGDLVKIVKNEYFPSDLLILSSSDVKGMAYIETKNLDGETNLKHKLAQKEIHGYFKGGDKFDDFSGQIKCEEANSIIYQFNGVLSFKDLAVPVSNDQFLLRGSSLKNTDWIVGAVVYTGHQTKIMLNSANARKKTSKLEGQMNSQIIYIFLMQLMLCAACSLYYSYWYYHNRWVTDIYLELVTSGENSDPVYQFVVQFFTWMLIFTNFVPISLLVTLEMVRFMQAALISKDLKMYYEPDDIPAGVQSSNLNEELGQINYIFSDKTGTLTRNVMEFKKMSVNGKKFGKSEHLDVNRKLPHVDFIDESFDPTEIEYLDYLTHLAVCHTIITEEKDGIIDYKASSPDELALVNAARFFGFKFAGRDSEQNLILMIGENQLLINVLNVIEFTSDRKRMSVVIRLPNGKYKILCKGADTILLPRLKSNPIVEPTYKHLEDFACEGLRTLVLTQRELSELEYRLWNEKYLEAARDILNKEKRIAEVAELVEVDLDLVGATAIEDRLQDRVPESIRHLREAGIKVWVLTGDKIETAINIGFSCNLLSNSMTRIIIEKNSESEVKEELEQGLISSQSSPTVDFALVISGDALLRASRPKLAPLLVKLADLCKAVLCCRVSPQQKADVVKLVRLAKPSALTLAIGDGANDVNMITAAHVGIGIAGLEGSQAVRASDYSIGQFAYVQRLLFVHGRECYRRNATLICFNFYKNVLCVIPLLYYGMFSAFSGQLLYNLWTYQLFNIMFCAMPIVVYAIFDIEIPHSELHSNPKFFKLGLHGKLFSTSIFWFWVLEAFVQGLIVVLISVFTICMTTGDQLHGKMDNMWVAAKLIFGLVVFLVNIKVYLFSYSHYWFSILISALSTLSYIGFTVLLNDYLPIRSWLDNYDGRGSSIRLLKNPNTYSAIAIVFFIAIMISPIYKAILTIHNMRKTQVAPQKLKKQDSSSLSSDSEERDVIEFEPEIKQEDWSSGLDKEKWKRRHTGFAFSGEAGHAPQITDPNYYL
jgi:phospholipid-transporting ATPase